MLCNNAHDDDDEIYAPLWEEGSPLRRAAVDPAAHAVRAALQDVVAVRFGMRVRRVAIAVLRRARGARGKPRGLSPEPRRRLAGAEAVTGSVATAPRERDVRVGQTRRRVGAAQVARAQDAHLATKRETNQKRSERGR